MSKTHTRGDVIVEEIKIGDIHYDYNWGVCLIVEVISLPIRDDEGHWTWQSRIVSNGKIVDYDVHEKYSHYSSSLYTYEAYEVKLKI